MPTIGEIAHGKDIGRFPKKAFIWAVCSKCGKEHWVECRKGKPFYDICFDCSRPKKKEWEVITTEPYIGEIRRCCQIEGYAKIKTRCIYEECPNCGNRRWVQISSKGKYPKCRQCMNRGKIKEKSGTWKGGRKINHSGYILVRIYPDNPYYEMANTAGYVFEHRLVMAQQLGRCLKDWELVHHKGINYPINSILNKSDNVPENLKYIGLKGEHNTLVEQIMSQKDARIKELEAELTKRA